MEDKLPEKIWVRKPDIKANIGSWQKWSPRDRDGDYVQYVRVDK